MKQPRLVLLPLLLLLLALSFSPKRAHASASTITLQLYMETLCPYCANATVNLAPIVRHAVLGPLLRIEYVPWGNAKEQPDASSPPSADTGIQCQHGPAECALNTLLSCAIALQPSWFDFALCLEQAVLEGADRSTRAIADRCAPSPVATAALVACAEGPLGRALSRMAAARTAALDPPHEYVPWIVLNGVPLRSASDNLLAFVCVALDPASRAAARDVCRDPVVEEEQEEAQQQQQMVATS
jgi:interferon gamma-inducible protein 30